MPHEFDDFEHRALLKKILVFQMWQLDLTLQEVRQVDKSCSKYYHTIGYLPVPHTVTPRTNFFVPWMETNL